MYENYRHHSIYPTFSFHIYPCEYTKKRYTFLSSKKEVVEKEEGEFPSILEGSSYLWEFSQKKPIQKKKKQKSVEENIDYQKKKWEIKIEKVEKEINELYESSEIQYQELEEKYKEKKLYKKKLEKIGKIIIPSKKEEKKQEIKLMEEKWYHKYYWWRTKNNFLVIGGKNSTENEYLIKTYLGDNDYYFHTEDFGSGSFILFTEGKKPQEIDIYETAEGVFSLSSSWNITKEGKVFHVLGNQVSKTPPSGMSITKGSFMIYGKKEYSSIHQTILGYGLFEGRELMLAPYRIIQRIKGPTIKITPKPNIKKMKGKIMSDYLKRKLNIDLNNVSYLFSKPCNLF
jgi:predicted ribosome quality control (RQC) complex YloA/Tae2 family protein